MSISDETKDRRYLIFGGSGTLGRAFINTICHFDLKADVMVVSREELKQKKLVDLFPRVYARCGNIADRDDVHRAIRDFDPDYVFNFAALKHVDVAEKNPEECIKTNILGTLNIAEECADNEVDYCVFTSTDKAVLPINTYGMSKGISENYLYEMNKRSHLTKFKVFRWGNVLGSRGSVIHSFIRTIQEEGRVYITDKRMTRFWSHIEDIAYLMWDQFTREPFDRATLPEMKASKVLDLAEACAEFLGVNKFEIIETRIRPGEKIHECLWTAHDECVRSDTAPRYTKEELLGLIKRVFDEKNSYSWL